MKLEIQTQERTVITANETGFVVVEQIDHLGESKVLWIAPRLIDDLCRMLQLVREQAIKNRAEWLREEEQQ